MTVEGELEPISEGSPRAIIVATERIVVSGTASKRYGGEHEVVAECGGFSLVFSIKTGTKTDSFGNHDEVAGVLILFLAVVVNVFDVLVETEVDVPVVGVFLLQRADTPTDVKLANGRVIGREVDEGIECEVVESTGFTSVVKMVEVFTIIEVEIEIGHMIEVPFTGTWMNGPMVVDVAVAKANEECVGHWFFLLSSVEAVNMEHLTRHHAVDASYGVDERADDFTENALTTPFAVVKENVRNAVGDFAKSRTADACGQKVVVSRTVGLAEQFPCDGASQWIEKGHAVRESMLSGCVVEHATVKGMGELVARKAVVVPHPSVGEVVFNDVTAHSCPYAMLHVVVVAQ